ncbi:transposable element Tcb1 transposase [Trichonephila clavipes]|nr:transposable element Tcb1 transposase [Trichonephila clavipes]
MTRVAWPAYSPHLNPIEKRWDAHSRAVSSRFPPPATLIELETALQEEWRLFNSAAVDYLIEIMPSSRKSSRGVGGRPLTTPRGFSSKLGWNRSKSYCHLYGAQSYG